MPKVWFITGASKGFGRIWAEAALARGDQVAATARDPRTLDDLVERYGDDVLAHRLDVTDKATVDAVVNKAHERFGRLEVMMAWAGTLATKDAETAKALGEAGQDLPGPGRFPRRPRDQPGAPPGDSTGRTRRAEATVP